MGLALAGAGVGVEAQGVGGVAAWALGVQAPHMLQAVVVMTLRQMGRAVAQMRGRVSLMRPALSPRGRTPMWQNMIQMLMFMMSDSFLLT